MYVMVTNTFGYEWTWKGRSPEFQIKLHRPTGTIFVKGSAEEIRMVREVVELVALPMGSAVFIKDPQP